MAAKDEKVFLGGSCNPTKWREQIVIPGLEERKITFFDPLVPADQWTIANIPIEAKAKDQAQVLFFYIDKSTRGTTSLLEIALLAAGGRSVLLVIDENFLNGTKIEDDTVGNDEAEYMRLARTKLKNIAEELGVKVFSGEMRTLDKGDKHTATELAFFKEILDAIKELVKKLEKSPAKPSGSGAKGKCKICEQQKGAKGTVINVSGTVLGVLEGLDASHHIGSGCKNVQLSVQDLTPGQDIKIKGDTLSKVNVKDYNRMRDYLKDFAKKAGIKVQ